MCEKQPNSLLIKCQRVDATSLWCIFLKSCSCSFWEGGCNKRKWDITSLMILSLWLASVQKLMWIFNYSLDNTGKSLRYYWYNVLSVLHYWRITNIWVGWYLCLCLQIPCMLSVAVVNVISVTPNTHIFINRKIWCKTHEVRTQTDGKATELCVIFPLIKKTSTLWRS